MAPREVPELDDEFKESLRGPKIDCVQNWNGKGNLATYGELEAKMTQKYRLLGEECVVIGRGSRRRRSAPRGQDTGGEVRMGRVVSRDGRRRWPNSRAL